MACHRRGGPRGTLGCAKVCWTRPTPPRPYGKTPPTDRPSTRPSWPRTASCPASIAEQTCGANGQRPLALVRRANNAKTEIRAHVEHVFAQQKDRILPAIRTVGLARATTKIGLANLVYNVKRLITFVAFNCREPRPGDQVINPTPRTAVNRISSPNPHHGGPSDGDDITVHFFAHASGMRPALISAFSACVFRCRAPAPAWRPRSDLRQPLQQASPAGASGWLRRTWRCTPPNCTLFRPDSLA